MASGWGVIFIFSILGVIIWYFLNRASVKANRQVQLLESIDKKLSLLIEPQSRDNSADDQSKEGYLEEARRRAGL